MLNKFKIGHYTDTENGTGVTVILCEDGAVGGVSVRGASPASRETDLLKPEKTVEKINAVVLSGGSAFGLEASCGVMQYLDEHNVGFKVNDNHIPIVSGASIYDVEYKNFSYPTKQHGYIASQRAKADNFEYGNIGVGTGATVGKLLGMKNCQKGGLGIETYCANGVEIAVVVAVNALGDIVDNGKIIAGLNDNGVFLDSAKLMANELSNPQYANTTIGCILTNAKLTKVQTNILADISHDGFAMAISPSHTAFDGDAMFCMASGDINVNFNSLMAVIPVLTKKAILRAVEK